MQFVRVALVLGVLSSTAVPQDSVNPDHLLDTMRAYVEHYVANLPNFICLQTIEQFETGRKKERWVKKNTLAFRLVFDGSREQQSLELVNGQPPKTATRKVIHRPLVTEGEFAILLANVFGAGSNAMFQPKGWKDLDGRRLAVYDYSIDKEHSTLKLSLSDLAQAVLAYHGSVYADPADGAIWHVSDEADEIPPEIKTRSIATSIDYGTVTLGGVAYLLPVEASVRVATDSGYLRSNIYFRNYQKFEAQSTITFQSDGSSDGLPQRKSGQQEKPPERER
ncbi:MAG: hypothetical protein JO028_04390 [Acidobacteriaceae bacterium]|nr:hypothetical protein [Acidobacteriaceae bacterium]